MIHRRLDSQEAFARIQERLVKRFGARNVYFDIETMPYISGLPQHVRQKVRQCDAALVLVGNQGLQSSSADMRRALDDPYDIVRLEIEEAFDAGIPIIPVLLDGAPLPAPTELPATLARVPFLNGLVVESGSNFDIHVNRLIGAVKEQVEINRKARRMALRQRTWRRELRLLGIAAIRVAITLVAATSGLVLVATAATGLRLLPLLQSPPPPIQLESSSIAVSGANDGWAVGTKGRIWHLTQLAGQNQPQWGLVASPLSKDLTSVAMISTHEGWAVGHGGVLLHYREPPGRVGEWIQVVGPSTQDLYGIVMISATDGWAVGAAGTILHESNGTWSLVSPPARCDLRALALSVGSNGSVIGSAVGLHSCVLHYDNGNWSLAQFAFSRDIDLTAVSLTSKDDGWGVGKGGAIVQYLGSDPSTVDWAEVPPLTTAALWGVSMDSEGEGWAVGDTGSILHFHDHEWINAKQSGTKSNLSGIAIVSPGEAWAFGAEGAFIHYVNGAWTSYTG
jgi:photosystem II stability/assembly factor-like uncharacterized protein